jgi:hypothetical protein
MKSDRRLLKRWHETISGHRAQLPVWRRRRRRRRRRRMMMKMKTFVSFSAILLC